MSDARDDNAVGYRRPPSRTRFRPGQSGNPSGRPKRRPTFRDVLLAELAATTADGKPERSRSKLQALVRTLVDTAIAGNARAESVLVAALSRMGDAEQHKSPSLTVDDREILDAYVGDELERRAAAADPSKVATERPADRQSEAPLEADDQHKKRGRE
jgi:Family of unknown function (DUF5681)